MRPIFASVLVLVFAHGARAADEEVAAETTSEETVAATPSLENGEYYSVYDYAGRCTFRIVYDCGTNVVSRFPLRLQIRDGSPAGFRYKDLRNGMNDLRFFDSTGRVLPYEVESWDTRGTSTFWLLLPQLREDATFTMCWNLRDRCTLPGNDPLAVWSDYVGVWHMDETITSDKASSTWSADATGHGLDAMPNCKEHDGKPQGDLKQMVSTGGVFGNARVNATECKQWGNHLEVPSYDEYELGGSFTVSCWMRFDGLERYPQLFCRKEKTSDDTCKGWHIESRQTEDRKMLTVRGDGYPNADIATFDSNPVGTEAFYNLVFVFNGTTVSVYNNGVLRGSGTIKAASDNGLPLLIGCGHLGEWKVNNDFRCIDGAYDEVRLSKGVKDADWIAAEYALGTNAVFYVSGAVSNDVGAVLKNGWKQPPTITKTTWDVGTYPTSQDITFEPEHGTKDETTVIFYNRATGAEIGRATGWDYGAKIPRTKGEYRVVFQVAENGTEATGIWGALEYTLEFRIVTPGGSHDMGVNIDRVMLFNDDESVEGGKVEWQSYSDELETDEFPYWQHLDENGENASSPSSPEYEDLWSVVGAFNLGGGTRHVYWYRGDWLWFLDGVRIGNTFRNGAFYPDDYGDAGLFDNQNYLPWNYVSQRVIGDTDDIVDGWHRYVGHAAMQNKMDAVITSALYTNGIGTIYFDAVNGWTDNLYDEDGNPLYQLVVEIATETKVDKFGQTHLPLVSFTSSNPSKGTGAYDPYYNADWKAVPMHVLRFDNGNCTDLGERSALTLDIENGGSCGHFYRVYVPVTNAMQNARFRIRRTAIDPFYEQDPDGYAFILVDNIICSPPTTCVQLEPYGEYFPDKVGKQVLGREGAFIPSFPSTTDETVYGRAKATVNGGQPAPAGAVSAATMHYRWHYLDQKTTGWMVADLNPSTFVTMRPLSLPAFQGDIDFWFELNQSGQYYDYADYSGTGLGLAGKYSEEVSSVTNQPSGTDWFVRTREGKGDYSEMKIVIRGSATPLDMYLSADRIWRGYYPMTNAIAGGIYWRIEPRNRQTDGAREWNWSTNYWYVADWDQSSSTLPKFPAASRLSEGDTNSWSRMPCDKQTGYLMFQVDESSLGVTVVRADYQDFNMWDDAAKPYFVGAAADPTVGPGTSIKARQYVERYASWPDTPATNAAWQLNFNNDKIGDPNYPGYVPFSKIEGHYDAWQIGKGMWVYNRYREPKSHVALQMAGNGEGYAEFSNYDVIRSWPRGVESVSFKARIAQAVSPVDAAYFDEGKRLTDYTFAANTCFDRKKNMGFAGNASLSLFAYYRAGEGAYEARWEQVSGKITDNPLYKTEVLEPNPRGQRLVISRWDAVGNLYEETVLCAYTNNVSFSKGGYDMPVMPFNGSSYTNNMMPFCISVFEEDGTNIIVAAVRITQQAETAGKSGVDWNVDVKGDSWHFVYACDGSSKRLKGGTYGVLPSNCEGMFLNPQFRQAATYSSNTSPAKMLKNGKGCDSNQPMNNTVGFRDCYEDIPWWEVDPGRVSVVYDFYDHSRPFGFAYAVPSQTVEVCVAAMNSSSWVKIGEVPLTGFGSPGKEPDCDPTFYYTSDCKLRLQTGGELWDYPIGVAINDIVIRQWRGYNSGEDKSVAYYHTNFVFTSGWVTNGATQLSARRTEVGKPCSVRSPLLDGDYKIGEGLGSFSFTYREPDENIRLLVQIATNILTDLSTITGSIEEGTTGYNSWLTVDRLDYDALWKTNENPVVNNTKTWSRSFGYHGARGLMRVIVDPTLVEEVVAETNVAKFGSIDITQVNCTDEPALDKGCWWGWNMQTIGNNFDIQKRMYLPDVSTDPALLGYSLALNNSITADVDPSIRIEDIRQHMPFVQSPTFTNGNAAIGQITFKARKYDLSDLAPDAKVVVYGAKKNPDNLQYDSDWDYIAEFPITNTIYTTYTCKTDSSDFYALRLGVVDVVGTQHKPDQPPPGGPAQRVLIDEVTVSESVRAMLSFRNVGAFKSYLATNCYVHGVTTSKEQPLCDENWGVQAELYATMLGEEIDPSSEPEVKLHWYVGTDLWGYEKWKKCETGSAFLAPVEGVTNVFRSSYKTCPDAVMPAQLEPGTVVQYMLEVRYQTINSTKKGSDPVPATNWLDATSWTVPAWYAPVDYNTDPAYGAGKTFAAFTILDTIAPGWAWINEVNLFGTYDKYWQNSDKEFQYVELCVPAEADLTGWTVRMLEAGVYNNKVTTNNVAAFGTPEFTGTKKGNVGMASNMVFRSIGNKNYAPSAGKMSKADGTLDGVWSFDDSALGGIFSRTSSGLYFIGDVEIPFGVQLVRPTGIIEHSVVVVGTNGWEGVISAYDPTNIVALLNKNVPGSKFFYAGPDECGEFHSDSVTDSRGESADHWANDWACSPGRINTNFTGQVQQIDPDHPTPSGDSIIVYAMVDTSFGHITQHVGSPDSTATNASEMIILQRGSARGTNIYYTVDRWYEMKNVVTNGAVAWVPGAGKTPNPFMFNVGRGASNNINVVASAQVDRRLASEYGLTPDNPYTPAVMDWLVNGKNCYDKPFAGDADNIYLSDVMDIRDNIVTNLTLTQMYWLDIDPTVSNHVLKIGVLDPMPDQATCVINNEEVKTDKVSVYVSISNRYDNTIWSPYVIRGVQPKSTSWDYDGYSSPAWTSATFKVTGILLNGNTSKDNINCWVPLRWFVFHEDSFFQPSDDPEEEKLHPRYTAEVEIIDPHSISSPAADAGWYDWFKEHPETPFGYGCTIDPRLRPVSAEVLHPTNFYPRAESSD